MEISNSIQNQWLGNHQERILIRNEASISEAREKARFLGSCLNLSIPTIETMAIIISELGFNQLRHAKRGEIVVRPIEQDGVRGLEVIAADRGQGIKNPRQALKEQHSTAGGLGAGLFGVWHLADEVDFDIRLGEGSCVWARKFETTPVGRGMDLAIMGRAYPGEAFSGDQGIFIRSPESVLLAVADGVGHGYLAHQASTKAISTIIERYNKDLGDILLSCSQNLQKTRGCMLALIRDEFKTTNLQFSGVGDISTQLYHFKQSMSFKGQHHTLGDGIYSNWQPQVEEAIVHAGGVLTMFTDGLRSQAGLQLDLELQRQPAVVIAQHLLETYGRTNDDALVLVAKFGRKL